MWRGKKEDYIQVRLTYAFNHVLNPFLSDFQVATSETLDPRSIEEVLKTCTSIADCCVVGNNFLQKPSEFICAIILPVYLQRISTSAAIEHAPISPKQMADITRAIASVNRTLPPPLRITWSRVLLLDEEKRIPRTKKGVIFRKKLENEFGPLLASHLTGKTESGHAASISLQEDNGASGRTWTKDTAENLVVSLVAGILGISLDALAANADLSFAEVNTFR